MEGLRDHDVDWADGTGETPRMKDNQGFRPKEKLQIGSHSNSFPFLLKYDMVYF